ncbi:MAG: tetratricopeptide repeat protein [Planctomycetes bacterium]|nr:tetratricopeptide repeat protein [Planctomycetota bacterium]
MAQGLEFDLKQLVLSNRSFGPAEIDQIVGAISEDFANYRLLREAVAELEVREDPTPASAVRLGVCYYLLGRYRRAIETLRGADGGALAHYYMGKSHFSLQEYDEAAKCYESAGTAGYDRDLCVLSQTEAARCGGNAAGALQSLDSLCGAIEQTAEYLYQRGAAVAAQGGNPTEVVALYERAVDADGSHVGALFGLAMENDRRGNDHKALQLYERSASRFPTHVGSLLNLGLLYEDNQQYDKAVHCYQRILDDFPNHPRAALYFKDAQASRDMYYDEEAQRKRDRMNQIMNIPVSDFELSVRSRNCLTKMGIMTLGDLCRTSEQQLLASKNFGETSLVEIREMLHSRGLDLGQVTQDEDDALPAYDESDLSNEERALLDRPILDLNLSVRARKCMIRLGINTISELVRKTGDELLDCKNFGVTSLNEVREKLTLQSLRLRGE